MNPTPETKVKQLGNKSLTCVAVMGAAFVLLLIFDGWIEWPCIITVVAAAVQSCRYSQRAEFYRRMIDAED